MVCGSPDSLSSIARINYCGREGAPLPEFNNREDLEVWLGDQPREASVVIAARAALRVLPFVDAAFTRRRVAPGTRAAFVLPAFRACAASWAVARYQDEFARLAAAASSASADAAVAVAGATSRSASAGCAIDAASLASGAAVGTASADRVADIAASAVDAAMTAAEAVVRAAGSREYVIQPPALIASSLPGFWASVSRDATAIEDGLSAQQLASEPLWMAGREVPDWAMVRWQRLKRRLLEADEGWKVWIEWYEARLVGGPTYHLSPKDSEEIEVACALIPNETWGAGPAAVNAEIRRIVEEYSKLSPGERVTEESSDQPIDLGEGHLPQGRTTDAAISPQEVAEHRTAIRMSIDSLSKSIDLELERLGAKPNDTQKLEEWETRSSFLGELEARIFEIQNSLAMLPDGQSTPADEVTAGFLKSLATEFEVWLTTNRPDLVDWIARLGVASGLIGLMSMLGAYMPVATSIVLAMTCGKGARDIILGKQNNQKKD